MAVFPSIPEPLVSRQKGGNPMKLLQRGCSGAAFYPQKTLSSPAWEGGREGGVSFHHHPSACLIFPPASSRRIF